MSEVENIVLEVGQVRRWSLDASLCAKIVAINTNETCDMLVLSSPWQDKSTKWLVGTIYENYSWSRLSAEGTEWTVVPTECGKCGRRNPCYLLEERCAGCRR